jgi:hypothetical protein
MTMLYNEGKNTLRLAEYFETWQLQLDTWNQELTYRTSIYIVIANNQSINTDDLMLTYKKLPAMIKYVMMETKWNKT